MKKIIMFICICLLCACQGQSNTKPATSTSQQKEDLVFKGWPFISRGGDGNKNGYYYINTRNINEQTPFNICYYDYATKQETVLCDKPECQHNDETCASFLLSGFTDKLFVYNDSIFIIESRGVSIDSLGQRQETGPKIIKRNLDGSGPQNVYTLENGYQFDYTNFAIADDILYLKVTKQKDYKVSKNSHMQVDIEKKLFSINLKTGDAKSILDFMNKDIVGVSGKNFILKNTIFKEDPMKYIEEGNYSKYDNLWLTSSSGYSTFNIDTLEESEIVKADLDSPTYYKGKLYSTEKDGIYSFDINNKEKKKLISYNNNLSYYLQYISEDNILLNEHKNDDDFTFVSSYVIDINNPKMQKVSFATRAPKQPVEILSETQDSFLVKYDREGHTEKTWAGTDQYEETKQYVGLIKKSDYFENKANYQNIELLK